MKSNWVLFFMATFVFSLLVGCVADKENQKLYSVLVVQNGDDQTDEIINQAIDFLSGKFHKVEFLMSLEDAQKHYPKYEIEQVPAVFIFETGGGELKQLAFKTYDLEEAVEKLKELSN